MRRLAMSVRRSWQVALLLIAAMVLAPVALRAQTDTTAVTHTVTTTEDHDRGFPWGLLGLLGLAGLIPRKQRDVHVHEHETYTTRPAPPRDDRVDPTPPPPRV
jgi:MYXO-CTERM domain-containing protein